MAEQPTAGTHANSLSEAIGDIAEILRPELSSADRAIRAEEITVGALTRLTSEDTDQPVWDMPGWRGRGNFPA